MQSGRQKLVDRQEMLIDRKQAGRHSRSVWRL